jgi:hypothetical protein
MKRLAQARAISLQPGEANLARLVVIYVVFGEAMCQD